MTRTPYRIRGLLVTLLLLGVVLLSLLQGRQSQADAGALALAGVVGIQAGQQWDRQGFAFLFACVGIVGGIWLIWQGIATWPK